MFTQAKKKKDWVKFSIQTTVCFTKKQLKEPYEACYGARGETTIVHCIHVSIVWNKMGVWPFLNKQTFVLVHTLLKQTVYNDATCFISVAE